MKYAEPKSGHYIFRKYITKNGRRYNAEDYGLKAFRIWVD